MSPTVVAVLSAWSFEPPIAAGLVLAAGVYVHGWRRWQARSHRPVLSAWQAWCYLLGLSVVVLALLSPLAEFDDDFLFLHMIQHVLLLLVAPPLLWLGAPLVPFLWAIPSDVRRRLGRLFRRGRPARRGLHALTDARVTASVFLAVVGAWHLPALYDLAQGDTFAHGLEHTLFLGAGLLYWWPVVHAGGGRRRLSYGLTMVYLFVATLEGFLIGAGLTLTHAIIYAHYAQAALTRSTVYAHPPLPGSALADQQLGGLVMWIPTGVLWMVGIIAVFVRWVSASGERSDQMFLYFGSLGRR